jgi:hypothetical protein
VQHLTRIVFLNFREFMSAPVAGPNATPGSTDAAGAAGKPHPERIARKIISIFND